MRSPLRRLQSKKWLSGIIGWRCATFEGEEISSHSLFSQLNKIDNEDDLSKVFKNY